MSTSLKLYATNDGKAVNSTFSSVNPNATAAQMKAAAQALNSLTDNTYAKSEKIETVDLDAAAQKLSPSLVLTQELPEGGLLRSWILEGPGRSLAVSYTGDGELSIVNNDNTSWMTTFRRNPETGQLNLYVGTLRTDTQVTATAPHDIVIRSAETANYNAGEFTFTIIDG